jgi:hypothetical protein
MKNANVLGEGLCLMFLEFKFCQKFKLQKIQGFPDCLYFFYRKSIGFDEVKNVNFLLATEACKI